MSSLVVESPGLLTTVQDLGRVGYGAMGVSPSGAADPVALQIGNRLVGNAPGAAALEMTLTGGTFAFPEGGVICLAGADFGVQFDGRELVPWRAHAVLPGKRVASGATRDFARCYLCVAGGIQVEEFLGSASTHLLSGLGGWHGRALQKGDILSVGEVKYRIRQKKMAEGILDALRPRKTLRVTRGPQFGWFAEEVQKRLFEEEFRVTEDANRMGLRLEGPLLATQEKKEMISEGAPLGAIQVTPSGQAIVLFVEQQTTGGYPKIANVIGADLHGVGQLRPRDTIQFEEVSFEEARALWIERQRLLGSEERLFQ
jgi:antagonist of KipI